MGKGEASGLTTEILKTMLFRRVGFRRFTKKKCCLTWNGALLAKKGGRESFWGMCLEIYKDRKLSRARPLEGGLGRQKSSFTPERKQRATAKEGGGATEWFRHLKHGNRQVKRGG